ncbi:hypothetical protein [Tardiphaga robiniae]|uniref:Uncharacterized protein n=1 Tax=Tardiphaga robiniae TaxID=943830 RepID=A0A7G6U4S0_9BRAD|nr:hypothetical protein [Tardiphaga robiniae]QND74002.1 hypothetical protein HB776_24505 [Tardiphaga robiniae]
MKTRQLELLKDLAKIASKYKASDWEAALKLLSGTTAPAKAKKPAARDTVTARTKVVAPKSKARIAPVRSKKVVKGKAEKTKAFNRKPLPVRKIDEIEISLELFLSSVPPRQLRFAYSGLFHAKETPESRQQTISDIKRHLLSLPEADRNLLVDRLLRQDNPSENYRRWLQIISPQPSRK